MTTLTGQLSALAGIIIFGTVDYFGFNLLKDRALRSYRILQGLIQAMITYGLYAWTGLGPAVGFNLIWWTGGADAVYYLWAEGSNGFGIDGWTGKRSTKVVLREGANWFEWTPVGLVQRSSRQKGLPADTLVLQLIIGLVVGILVAGL